MIRGLNSLAARHLRSDVRQTALLVLGPAIGLALAVSVLCLGALLQESVDRQILEAYGPSDVWISYPDLCGYLSGEQVESIRSMRGVVAVAEGIVPPGLRAITASSGVRFQATSDSSIVPPVHSPGISLGPDEVAITAGLADRRGAKAGDWLSFPELARNTGGGSSPSSTSPRKRACRRWRTSTSRRCALSSTSETAPAGSMWSSTTGWTSTSSPRK